MAGTSRLGPQFIEAQGSPVAPGSRGEALPATARRVVYLIPCFYTYSVPVYEALYRRIGKGFVVVTMRNHPHTRLVAHMGTFPRRLLGGLLVELSRHHNQGKESPYGIAWAPSIPLVVASLKPEVVVSENFNLCTLTSITMGYPTVIAWEGTHHTERTVQPWRKRVRIWMAQRAKAFVVNGVLARQYLVEALGVPAERIIEGSLCSTPPLPQLRRGPRILEPNEPVRFLFVGRMIELKGLPHLLRATQLLKRRLGHERHFEVCAVGDGPDRTRYEQLAQELGLDDRVDFVRHVPYDQVWQYYARAHVFVLPTLQDNWPLVVPEAMSMGLPVLLSKYAGSGPDLIREGENGYTFDPEDHQALASCMERYVRTPDLVREHGKRALQLVSPYNPERVASNILRAIDKASLKTNSFASMSLGR